MINNITEHIAGKLELSGIWGKVYQYVEQHFSSEGNAQPCTYSGNGNYKPLDYDKNRGTVYTRKRGSIEVSPVEDLSSGCKLLNKYIIPFRIVSIVKKSQVGDNCFADDLMSSNIISILSDKFTGLATDMGAKRTTIEISEINDERDKILSDEYPGTLMKDFNYLYSYIAVDFRVEVIANSDCINKLCEAYG
jgi:hypothetical protein